MNLRARVAALASAAGLATFGLASSIGGLAGGPAEAAPAPATPSVARSVAPSVAWSVGAMPAPAGPEVVVKAVSCPTTSFCMAVGWALDWGGSRPTPSRPVAETWNGHTWTIRHPTTPAGETNTQLTAVSCPTATDCTAVGGTGRGGPSLPLAEVWNGRTWRVEDVADPDQGDLLELESVSCPSTAYCAAVGSDDGINEGDFREQWHSGGRGWQSTSPLRADVNVRLYSIWCHDRDTCVAGGEDGNSPKPGHPFTFRSLIQTWNGRTWSTARIGAVDDTEVIDVACSSAAACVATGNQRLGVGFSLVGRDGRWSVGPAPGLSPTALACAADRSLCVATGFDATKPTDPPLSSVWNGSTWSKAATVPATAGGADLSGVSCPSAGRCVAVGSSSSTADSRPIAAVGTVR